MRKIFFPSSKPTFLNRQEVIENLKGLAIGLSKKNKNIEAIYLFGSYAADNAGLRSDADILVVLREDSRGRLDRLDEFILEFSDAIIPVDVLVNTRSEIDAAIGEGNHFFVRAVGGIRLV